MTIQEKAPASGKHLRDTQPVIPHLVIDGVADAIEFYKKAFGGEELMRLPGPNGKIMHASMRIGRGIVMFTDEAPEWHSFSPIALKGTPVTVHLYVDDVDAAFDRAVKAGATAKMAPADMFWGDRYGQLVDPYGHKWSLATHQRDMTEAEIIDAMKKFMPSGGCDSAKS